MKSERWFGLGLGAILVIALASCGGEKVEQKAEAPLRVPLEPQAAVASASLAPAAHEEGEVVAGTDSLPPEVEVEVADSSVTPGEAVEITAIGSDDVREMLLTDGRGKATSFVYDLPSRSWKAYYRVPMRSGADRLGLSVTARNESHRWRRVWLFLEVKSPEVASVPGATAPDSTR
jgi:hypothetical protein